MLKDNHYLFRDRGCIEIKGKGQQHTYFLVGQNEKLITEPDDEYQTLSLLNTKSSQDTNGALIKQESKNTSQLCVVL